MIVQIFLYVIRAFKCWRHISKVVVKRNARCVFRIEWVNERSYNKITHFNAKNESVREYNYFSDFAVIQYNDFMFIHFYCVSHIIFTKHYFFIANRFFVLRPAYSERLNNIQCKSARSRIEKPYDKTFRGKILHFRICEKNSPIINFEYVTTSHIPRRPVTSAL